MLFSLLLKVIICKLKIPSLIRIYFWQMNNTSYVIGVDGGGTSTVARLADLQGNIISVVKAGPSNLQTYGPEKCAETLTDAITEVISKSKSTLNSVQLVVYGTAGAGRKADQERLHSAIQSRWDGLPHKPKSLVVVSDADIALEAAHGGEPGIIIIAGTGSIIYGRDTDNTFKRSGGWGPIIGDPGSGTAIGLEALRITAKTIDGCIEAGDLVKLIAEDTGITSQESMIQKVYRDKIPPSSIAPLVFKAADNGDKYAIDIIKKGADDLVNMLECGIKRFSFTGAIPISFVGGLLQSDTQYPDIVSKIIKEKIPLAEIRNHKFKPEEGAIAMAIRLVQNN